MSGSERTVLRPNTRAITVTFDEKEEEEEVQIGRGDETRRLSLNLLSADLISIRILINLLLHRSGGLQRRKCVSLRQ